MNDYCKICSLKRYIDPPFEGKILEKICSCGNIEKYVWCCIHDKICIKIGQCREKNLYVRIGKSFLFSVACETPAPITKESNTYLGKLILINK